MTRAAYQLELEVARVRAAARNDSDAQNQLQVGKKRSGSSRSPAGRTVLGRRADVYRDCDCAGPGSAVPYSEADA
jgi:hypothetical protein